MAECIFLVALVLAQPPEVSKKRFENSPMELEAAKAKLQRELQLDALWLSSDDQEKRRRLLSLLWAAENMRAVGVAPILARNITFDAELGRPAGVDRAHPAYRVLKSFGLDAVKPIVNELGNFDVAEERKVPSKRPEDFKTKDEWLKHQALLAQREHRFHLDIKRSSLVECLIEIYDVGGFGRELARQRLELEMGNVSGKEKERLKQALKDAFRK